MWVKWLRRIEVGDQPWHHREETSKYTDLLENGKARRFTYVMDAKSVITSPSPQAPLNHKSGFTVLSGIAWSGPRQDRARRRLARWRPQLAHRDDRRRRSGTRRSPVSITNSTGTAANYCCNRARWTRPVMCSRAKNELRKFRGVNSIYHNNGIQTWHVHKNGEVENVESVLIAPRSPRRFCSVLFAGAACRRQSCRRQPSCTGTEEARHRPRSDHGRNRRLGHRHPSGRARAAGRQGNV